MIARAFAVVLLLAVTAWAPPDVVRSMTTARDDSATVVWPGRPPVPDVRPTARVLSIVWRHQEHRLSCEAAALRMALSHFGIGAGELTLLGYMGYDERPAVFDAKVHLVRWGDPNTAYVGNPDGHIERYTGYGVYFAPVARAATSSGVGVLAAGSGISPAEVYDAILHGHPVVAWISNTYHRVPLSSYVAYDGSRVLYTLTEHAVTVAGVRPDGVLIDDPWFGPGWHSKAQFESAFATFGDMAVILSRP